MSRQFRKCQRLLAILLNQYATNKRYTFIVFEVRCNGALDRVYCARRGWFNSNTSNFYCFNGDSDSGQFHLVWDQDIVGSNPTSPTSYEYCPDWGLGCDEFLLSRLCGSIPHLLTKFRARMVCQLDLKPEADGFDSRQVHQILRGMGRVPRFALQADSLIGSSPIFSTILYTVGLLVRSVAFQATQMGS